MSYVSPPPDSRWRRKKDGRVDVAKGCDLRHVLMYSPATGRHWHIELPGLYRKYEKVEDAPDVWEKYRESHHA